MLYRKHVSEPWFTLIGKGDKTIEGRLCKGSFAELREGDMIVWFNDDFGYRREAPTVITRIRKHPTFRQYLEKETLKRCLPDAKNARIRKTHRIQGVLASSQDRWFVSAGSFPRIAAINPLLQPATTKKPQGVLFYMVGCWNRPNIFIALWRGYSAYSDEGSP